MLMLKRRWSWPACHQRHSHAAHTISQRACCWWVAQLLVAPTAMVHGNHSSLFDVRTS